MNYAISVRDLEKSYGHHKVLKRVSFQVKRGEIFALLGINGAGKTTILECLEGLRKYDSGSIDIQGKCGVQLQSSSLPKQLKGIEAIRYFAKWQNIAVDKTYIKQMGIENLLHKQYEQMSTGQKRRLHLVLALLGNPDIIFLDEPTAGLDVRGRVELHNEIKRLKAMGKTIVLASHDMAEVEELCDHIALLRDGNIAFTGTVQELIGKIENVYQLHICFSKDIDFEKGNLDCHYQKEKKDYIFYTAFIEETLLKIIPFILKQKASIKNIRVENATLEQRFLEIVKGE